MKKPRQAFPAHARFNRRVQPARCPLLGWNPASIVVEGRPIGSWFFQVENQPDVGAEAYDQGADTLARFFHQELDQFLSSDLDPIGRKIIDCCLSGGSLSDYESLIDPPVLTEDQRFRMFGSSKEVAFGS